MWILMYNELVLFCQGSVLEEGVSLFVFLVGVLVSEPSG